VLLQEDRRFLTLNGSPNKMAAKMGSLRALVARAGACAATGVTAACDGATVGDDGMPVAERSYSRRELGEHRSAKNCWVAINSSIFDVTAFLARHPGGASALQQYCGKDGSSAFGALHGAGVLADVGGPYRVGALAPDGGAAIMTSATPAGFQHPTGEALASGAAKKAFDGAPRLDAEALADLRSLDDVEEAALALLPEALALYVNYGAEDETSKARNRRAWEDVLLRPRVLAATRAPDASATLFGAATRTPVYVAPFATARASHPDGEVAIAAAARDRGGAFCVPHFGGHPLEDVAAVGAPLLVQLYPPRDAAGGLDRAYAAAALRHAEASGVLAVVVTVDTPVDGNRLRTYRDPAWLRRVGDQLGAFPAVRTFEAAGLPRHPGIAAHMTWDDVAWMRAASSLKVVVKGVMTREDAEIAAARADGIVVSNHGGRQLDGVAGTAEVLRECVRGAGGAVPVFVDGGVRRGKDVFRALALGASGVFVGRPVLHGLAAGGAPGAARVLEILEDELKRTMALCGCETLADITPAHVAPPPAPPPRLDWIRAETADGAPYWYVSTWDPPGPQ